MTHRRLILSSSSKARRNLLDQLTIPFLAVSPDVDETPLAHEDAVAMVKRLAKRKAEVTAAKHADAFIIGCDQVGLLDNTLLCKPLTHENAVKQLRLVSSRSVRFFTALCLYDAKTHKAQLAVEVYDVFFRHLSDALIERYLQKEQPYHCAGSFQIEGLGIALIKKLAGDDYTALIGLPLIRLTEMLENVGLSPFQ